MKNKKILKLLTVLTLASSGYILTDLMVANPSIVYAQESEAETLISRIDNLPPVEDLDETHAEEVKALMNVYAELKMSDRIAVTNYDTLKEDFDALVKKGILTNEDNTILQEQEAQKKKQSQKDISDTAISQAKEYTFLSDGKTGRSIIIRYTTDGDGDGVGDQPTRIILTSPDGSTYPVSNTSISMSDGDKMKVDLTWTDLYLQLDFSQFEKGKWSIETSQAVTFSATEYSGAASDVNSLEDEEDESSTSVEAEKPKKKSRIIPLLILTSIVAVVGFLIAKFISVMKAPSAPTVNEENLPNGAEPKRLSDEEQLALIKEEYMRQLADAGIEEITPPTPPERDLNFEQDYLPTRRKPIQYDDEDPEPPKTKPETAIQFAMEEEEDTGLLKKEDKPEHMKEEKTPVDETASIFDGFS